MTKSAIFYFTIGLFFSEIIFAIQPTAQAGGIHAAGATVVANGKGETQPRISEKAKGLLAEIELDKKKALESISKSMKKIDELKKDREVTIGYLKTAQKLGVVGIWRRVCNVQIEEDFVAENPLAAGKAKTKEEKKRLRANWYECVNKKRQEDDANIDTAKLYVVIANEQVRNAEQSLITSIKYYNAIPGIKKLAVPSVSPPVFPMDILKGAKK